MRLIHKLIGFIHIYPLLSFYWISEYITKNDHEKQNNIRTYQLANWHVALIVIRVAAVPAVVSIP